MDLTVKVKRELTDEELAKMQASAEALKAVDNHTQDYVVMNYYSADYYIQDFDDVKNKSYEVL